MSYRPQIVLREGDGEDVASLIGLWRVCAHDSDSAAPAHTSTWWREPPVAEAAEAFERNFAGTDRRMVVALVEGKIVGVVCFQIITLSPINLTQTLLVTDLHVLPEVRRRSVATMLLSAAATAGEDANCEVFLTVSPANAREPNRFLAKLGFGQVSTVRGVQMSLLRSKLSGKATTRDTGKLIAVRRTMRRRQVESRREHTV